MEEEIGGEGRAPRTLRAPGTPSQDEVGSHSSTRSRGTGSGGSPGFGTSSRGQDEELPSGGSMDVEHAAAVISKYEEGVDGRTE